MHDTNLLEDQPIAWTPTPDVIERAQLTKFMRQVGVSTWDELYEFSIRDVERFTQEVLKFLDIKFDPPYERLLDTSNGVEFPTWFSTKRREDAKSGPPAVAGGSTQPTSEQEVTLPVGSVSSAGLNITTMCLDRWLGDGWNNEPAVIWEGEDGSTHALSYSFLADNVAILVGTLRGLGIGKGDAVGIHLPMIPETVLALLAINRVGAIAVPVFSGYGVEAIASRMQAVKAKALLTCEGFYRRGKFVDMMAVAADAVRRTNSISKVLVTKTAISEKEHFDQIKDTKGPLRFVEFQERLEKLFTDVTVRQFGISHNMIDLLGADEIGPEGTSAEDPLIILYTSGTTGKPKGIAHTHASFPIKAAQDMAFGTDVGRGTRICWYTDIGWMMGPWLIYGALINGATICIYDGAPDYPTPDRMWEFCAKHKVEVLGISPTLIRSLAASEENSLPYEGGVADSAYSAESDGVVLSSKEMSKRADKELENHPPAEAVPFLRKEGSYRAPFERHDLSSLRVFASTGEPWNPAPWWWLFEKVGSTNLPIINYSGGTEIAGGILMGNPLLPIKPCSFPAPCPGMDVDILNEDGEPVKPAEVGELVIKQPWIGMARGFWQEKERYLDTYWRRFKDIWVHGDWAMRDKDAHWFILGRSDDTLKVAGKRVGPAEVESLLVAHPLVTEAAVIGVPDDVKGTAMVAFVMTSDKGPVTSDEGPKGSSLSTQKPSQQEPTTSDVATGDLGNTGDGSPSSSPITHHSSLETELKALVSRDMGKPLAPSKIHFVSALPKTRNAKVMRRVIRSAYLGEDPGDLSALENPQSVDEIAALLSR
ncbi:MAG: AMP-binding protein [Pyrinomonadaceae bacterium]